VAVTGQKKFCHYQARFLPHLPLYFAHHLVKPQGGRMETEVSQVQAALLDLLARAHAVQQAWAAALSDAERQASGSAEQWAAKDTLAHIAFWQQTQAERIAAARQGAVPRDTNDFETINGQVFEEKHVQTWEQAQADAERAYAALVSEVRAAGTALLTDPSRLPWKTERALTSSILGNGFWHPFEHIARSYAERGDLASASAVQQQVVSAEDALQHIPGEQGAALYNAACFFATTRQPDRALALLPEALRLRPDLVEWSKQDSDLDSLRDLPDFQALYES
jgi:tetratricopeptide (TPR) repeat protein